MRAAVGDGYPVLLDGGIRGGGDVFRAIALGVAHMLKLLREELELHMALAGCSTLADITADRVRHEAVPPPARA